MAAPETAADNARCARCGGPFRCGAHDATPCPCTGLKLDAATLEALRGRYAGCLCLRCLAGFASTGGAAAGGAPVTTAAPDR